MNAIPFRHRSVSERGTQVRQDMEPRSGSEHGGLHDENVIQCPYPYYTQLRQEGSVHRQDVQGQDVYLVLRHADCTRVLADAEGFSSKVGPGLRPKASPEAKAILGQGPRLVRTLLTNDPPSHGRYRSIVSRAFTARRIRALEPHVQAVISDLIAEIDRSPTIDFVRRFSQPLPLLVIADFLGVPRSDLPEFRKWSDDAAALMGGNLKEEEELDCYRSLVRLLQYFEELIEARRGDLRDDYLSTLIRVGPEPLTTEEIIALAYVIIVAGNETTVNLLSSTMLMLATDPALQDAVRRDRSLIPKVIEEALRLESPIQGFPRLALKDSEVGGDTIPEGSRVLVMIGAANRDGDVFDEPDQVQADRSGAHLAFGYGIHFCLGAALSRLEVSLAVNALLDNFQAITIADPDFTARYDDNPVVRTLLSLPLQLAAAEGI